MSGYSTERVYRTREDLGHMLDFLAASLFVDDDRVFAEFADWLCDVLVSRSVPVEAVVVGLESVGKAVPDLPRATALVDHGRRGDVGLSRARARTGGRAGEYGRRRAGSGTPGGVA